MSAPTEITVWYDEKAPHQPWRWQIVATAAWPGPEPAGTVLSADTSQTRAHALEFARGVADLEIQRAYDRRTPPATFQHPSAPVPKSYGHPPWWRRR